MGARGYLTQCDQGGWSGFGEKPCPETRRLSKPGKFRCDACEKIYGPLSAEPRPTP